MKDLRADVVGSLLRPPELLQAREEHASGRLGAAELKKIEDNAVDGAVALQENAGLAVATDGEMRRLSFQSQMTDSVEGFAEHDINAFLWGDWQSEELGDWKVQRPELAVVSKLRRRRHLAAEEFTYLRARTALLAKVTLPSPTLFINFWSPERSTGAYPTLEEYLADLVSILRDEIAELVRLGATYIQLDAPQYASLLDPAQRAFYEGQGFAFERWLTRGLELENAVMDGFAEVTFGFHL